MAERAVSREAILDVAAKLFAERTYLGANLHDVAKELNVTRQALYYHFEKKHDILYAVFERLFRELNAAADATAGAGNPSFANLLRNHIAILANHPDLAKLSIEEHQHLPTELGRKVIKMRELYLDRFYAAYRAGVESGELNPIDARVAVQLSMGAANWLHRWYRPSGNLSPDNIADLAVQTLLSGFATGNNEHLDKELEPVGNEG